MLMVVTMPDIAAARRFIAGEPYNAHGYFESVEIRAWSHVIPEPHPGFIEEQYQAELKARNQ